MKLPITAKRLAKENVRRKAGRSFGLILVVTCLATLLFAGTHISRSLSRGVSSLSERLGADVMVVPAGYNANIESILLKGEPSSFYLPANTMELLRDIPGIEKMTPQLYVATLSASCCSYPVQIIGIDPETDFIINPWLTKTLRKNLGDDEAMVGGHIIGEHGEKIKFFNKIIEIAGRLENTGMGFDGTVFVNMATAVKLAKESERMGVNPAAEGERISCVMIQTKPGIDAAKLASLITEKLSDQGIFAMFSKRLVYSVAANLKVLAGYINGIVIAFWLVALLILGLTFSTLVNERKREMAVLRVMGAESKTLYGIFLWEAAIISFYGAIIGIGLGFISSLIVLPILSESLSIPFRNLAAGNVVVLVLSTLVLTMFSGTLSILPAIRRFKRQDPCSFIRD